MSTNRYNFFGWFFSLRLSLIVPISFVVLLSACSTKVTVVSNIPVPLVQKVPLNVHLSYTDEFKTHVYTEKEKDRVLSSLDLAQAQIEMFDTIFSNVATLVEAGYSHTDIIIEPHILEFQYTAPRETSLKQYEVWIKYRLKLFKPDSSKLADWIIKGYGKTPTATLKTSAQAFNAATNIALRDIGAQLAAQFSEQRKIKELIDQKNIAKSSKENAND